MRYLGPVPVEDGAGGGGRIAELRGGEEALAHTDEAVARRCASLVAELLGAAV